MRRTSKEAGKEYNGLVENRNELKVESKRSSQREKGKLSFRVLLN